MDNKGTDGKSRTVTSKADIQGCPIMAITHLQADKRKPHSDDDRTPQVKCSDLYSDDSMMSLDIKTQLEILKVKY